jgi:hypothetical protein
VSLHFSSVSLLVTHVPPNPSLPSAPFAICKLVQLCPLSQPSCFPSAHRAFLLPSGIVRHLLLSFWAAHSLVPVTTPPPQPLSMCGLCASSSWGVLLWNGYLGVSWSAKLSAQTCKPTHTLLLCAFSVTKHRLHRDLNSVGPSCFKSNQPGAWPLGLLLKGPMLPLVETVSGVHGGS